MSKVDKDEPAAELAVVVEPAVVPAPVVEPVGPSGGDRDSRRRELKVRLGAALASGDEQGAQAARDGLLAVAREAEASERAAAAAAVRQAAVVADPGESQVTPPRARTGRPDLHTTAG